MESERLSVNGKCAHVMLSNFMAKFPERAMEKLKRVLIFLAPKITNEDLFLGALYGQEALDATPMNLVRIPIKASNIYFVKIRNQDV